MTPGTTTTRQTRRQYITELVVAIHATGYGPGRSDDPDDRRRYHERLRAADERDRAIAIRMAWRDATRWREDQALARLARDIEMSGLANNEGMDPRLAPPPMSESAKAITTDDLLAILRGVRRATFATLTVCVDPKLRKTHRETGELLPIGNIRKLSRVNVCLCWEYERSVNRQRARESGAGVSNFDTFTAQPRKWGTRIPGTPLVEHNVRHGAQSGRYYLACKVERVYSTTYVDQAGNLIDADDLAGYLPTRKSNAEHQGVEKEVLERDYALESITGITLNGQTYTVDHQGADHA